jgi:hypothetical protein
MVFKPGRNLIVSSTCALLLVLACLLTGSLSCKKAIEKQQKNIIVDAMVNGRWLVEQYKETGTDRSTDFNMYEFQFYENGNVDGIRSTATKSGTWSADIANYTITASFPASAGDTLTLLNHTWKITDSYLNYVEAKTTTAAGENILHLRKK